MSTDERKTAERRVRRNFVVLAVATILAFGVLSTAIGKPPSPTIGLLTAISSTAALLGLALMTRIILVTTRPRRRR